MAIRIRARILSSIVKRCMSSTVVEPSVAVNHMSANNEHTTRIFRTNESNPTVLRWLPDEAASGMYLHQQILGSAVILSGRGGTYCNWRSFISLENSIPIFQRYETSPITVNHGENHLNLFYTVPPEVKQQLFLHGGLPKSFEKQVQTFQETCIMVRSPALEIMEYMKAADYSGPAIRYVLFGKPGCGKTISLAHILHFGFVSGFLLVHVPWVPNWFRRCKEVSNSNTKDGYFDLPLDAAAWLLHFKTQNASLLNTLNLKVSQEYVWSKREITKEGDPLTELIDLGLNRVKYASDIVVALIKEIKQASTSGRCKTLVALDGFNAFFSTKTRIKSDTKAMVLPPKVTLTEAFLDITKFDWCNGGVVLTVDELASCDERTGSNFPMYQLGRNGFEHLDPFVPVQIEEYNHQEINSCIEYYLDRRWLQSPKAKTDEGRKELAFLSGRNPFQLMKVCAPL